MRVWARISIKSTSAKGKQQLVQPSSKAHMPEHACAEYQPVTIPQNHSEAFILDLEREHVVKFSNKKGQGKDLIWFSTKHALFV